MKIRLLLASVLMTVSVFGQINFDSNVNFATGSQPHSGDLGDLDGDGKSDLVISNFMSGTISVYRNTSVNGSINSLSFSNKVDFVVGNYPVGVVISDIDGDSKNDLIITNRSTSGSISIFKNTSTPGAISSTSFATRVDFSVGNYPHFSAVKDLDGDGKLDIAVANYYSNTVTVLKNTSTPGIIDINSMASPVDFPSGSGPLAFEVADIDGDGKKDMIVGNRASGTVSIYQNTSTIGSIDINSFSAPVDLPAFAGIFDLSVEDIDSDGKKDIVLTGDPSFSKFSIIKNLSIPGIITSNSFDNSIDISMTNLSGPCDVNDFNSDGKPDVIVSNTSSNSISIFRNVSNNGSVTTSSFAAEVIISTPASPYFLFSGDIDGDSKSDIIVPCLSADVVSVLRNITPSSTSIPIIGCPGAQLPTNVLNGLVGWWPFCGDADDESGNGNNGTVNGATLTSDRFGNVNSAYQFDGFNDEIRIPDNTALNLIGDFSISSWYRTTSVPTNRNAHTIISKRDDGLSCCSPDIPFDLCINYQVGIPTDMNKPMVVVGNSGNYHYLQSSQDINIGIWNHVVATVKVDSIRIYLNGIQIHQEYIASSWRNSNSSSLLIGSVNRAFGDEYMNGDLDDIGIWNRALDSSEVAQLYNTGLCTQTIAGSCDTLIFNANITGFNPVTYANQVKVYPNPAADNLVIDCGTNYTGLNGYSIRITNLLGQTVYNSPVTAQITNIQLTPPTWVNGTYVVQFVHPNGTVMETKRVIIQ